MINNKYIILKETAFSKDLNKDYIKVELSNQLADLTESICKQAIENSLTYKKTLYILFEEIKGNLLDSENQINLNRLYPAFLTILSENRMLYQEFLEITSGLLVYHSRLPELINYIKRKLFKHLIRIYALKQGFSYYSKIFDSFESVETLSSLYEMDFFESFQNKILLVGIFRQQNLIEL